MEGFSARARRVAWFAVLALGYWAIARLGLSFGSLPGNAAPVWPATGFALGATILLGWRTTVPAIVVGEYFANRQGLPTLAVLAMCAGNALESVLGAALLKKAKVSRGLIRPRDVGSLILLAGGVATLCSALIGNVALLAGDVFPPADFWRHLGIWWFGDALGALIVTPLILTWTDRSALAREGNILEIAGLIVATGVTTTLALHSGGHPAAYLLYPVVGWAALRFDGRGASLMTALVSALAVNHTAKGHGPFASGDTVTDLWLLDAFLFVLATTGMLLSAVVNQRDRVRLDLEEANAALETKVAERTNALRVDRQRLEQAQQIAHIGSWEWDALTDEMTCSAEMQRLYGMELDATGLSIAEYMDKIHPDDRRFADEQVLAARATGSVFDFEHRVVVGGEVKWLRVRGQSDVVRGVVTRMKGIAQDVTEAKLAEGIIRANEERTMRIVDQASEAFVSMDIVGRITDWNHQAELTFGWRRDEVIGQPLAETIIPEAQRGAHAAGVSRYLSTGETNVLNTRREIVARHRDGHEFPVEVAAWVTKGAYGEPCFHAFMHDISERQAQKAQLAHALDEAREASKSKSAFLANMSHEIRTPMNGVLGMVGLLLDTRLDEQQLDYVQTMSMSADALLAIIDDILDVSKIEAGKLTLELGDFALRRFVQDTIAPFMPTVHDKGIELTAYVSPDIPDAINGDRLRLRQVLSNLLSNAVKFTSHGVVQLRVTRNAAGLLFAVRDTGVGITAQEATYLFDPFVQADPSTTRRYGGTGLGLAISRQLVTLMDGEIGAEPHPGGGSRFWFTLPLVAATTRPNAVEARRALPATVQPPSRRRRVLVVEDNAVNRKVAIGMLEQLGYSVEIAEDGAEAVEKFAPGAYDAILMDCQMPRMDGYDATVAIRHLDPERQTPIIAMTASAMASDRERCLGVGMDEYLSKPINRDLLATVLRETMESRDQPVSIDAPNSATDEAFDAETLEQLRSLDTDGSFIAELVGMFRDDIAQHVETLHAAIAARDEDTIARTAHQAKGASANLGMRALAASLKTLELSANASDDDLIAAMHVVETKVAEALAFVDTLVTV